MTVELRQLRYFAALAAEEHFGRAAAALGISQPTLSAQIARLEEAVGATLFERRPKVRLTRAGAALLDGARATLSAGDRAVADARAAAAGVVGSLVVGLVPSTLLVPHVTRCVRRYRERRPRVRLRLREMGSAAQVEAILEGRLDAGLIREPTEDAGLRCAVVFRERVVAALPADHPVAARRRVELADLAREPFVLFDRGVNPRLHDRIVGLCRHAGFSPRIVQEANELQTRASLVQAGLGVTLAPAGIRRFRVPGVAYRPLEGAHVRTPVGLCWRDGPQLPALRAFVTAFPGPGSTPGSPGDPALAAAAGAPGGAVDR